MSNPESGIVFTPCSSLRRDRESTRFRKLVGLKEVPVSEALRGESHGNGIFDWVACSGVEGKAFVNAAAKECREARCLEREREGNEGGQSLEC